MVDLQEDQLMPAADMSSQPQQLEEDVKNKIFSQDLRQYH
jgi:hypothetical protein